MPMVSGSSPHKPCGIVLSRYLADIRLEICTQTCVPFFLDRLGVSTMNAKLLLKALARASEPSQSPDGEKTKSIMMSAGQILAADQNTEGLKDILQDLKKNRYLPIRRDQGWTFAKASANYFVVDHERYGSAFRGKLSLLDFTYAELTSLHSLFQLLGLEHRYLSRHVDTETIVNTSYSSSDLASHLRHRAYALSW
jgi:hypothetical protein